MCNFLIWPMAPLCPSLPGLCFVIWFVSPCHFVSWLQNSVQSRFIASSYNRIGVF